MAKYNLMQMTKALEKLFNAGYKDEKSILSLQLEDLEKLQDISVVELSIIINLNALTHVTLLCSSISFLISIEDTK